MGKTEWKDDFKVVIVGAGFGGILAALRLKKTLGFENFVIYEKASEVGGTWRENTYPGCGCDVKSHWYSISSEPKHDWTQSFSGQPEILEYIKDVVDRTDLRRHIEFNTRLVHAEWDAENQRYAIELAREPNPTSDPDSHSISEENGNTSEAKHEFVYGNVLISAIGGLHVPIMPNIKGLDTFKGPMWHSARWRHDVSLKGKTVGIIGNGCSACQIIPVISADPSVKVVNFCRTPSWFAPRDQMTYGPVLHWMLKNVPGLRMFIRGIIYAFSDAQYIAWRRKSPIIRHAVETWMKWYIKRKAPKSLHNKLIPSYPFGCKRVIRDPGYLASLHRPNVTLDWDGIAEIVEDGVITKTGNHIKLDILVPCTGFDTTATVAPPVTGLNGATVLDYFKSQGGPTAYRGTTLPGFPNVFILLGPNVASGHASAVFVEEVQADYIVRIIEPMLRKGSDLQSATPKVEATDRYNDEIQAKLGDTVWTGCLSYYNQQGGKNVAMYPGFVTSFWNMMRKPKWEDYDVVRSGGGSKNDNLFSGRSPSRPIKATASKASGTSDDSATSRTASDASQIV